MPLEIERKFLLKNDHWKEMIHTCKIIKQGYLNSNKERTVRVRIINDQAFITIKSKNIGMVRQEFEYEIPKNDARELLLLCENPLIEKKRYEVLINNKTWEIDEFEGNNLGLIIAEVELKDENEAIVIPEWIGKEVTDDIRYFNSSLIKAPFTTW